MLKDVRIKGKTAIIVLTIVAGFLVAGASSYLVLEKLKVNGPIYKDIVQTKDLIADILPPPEYIIESYLTLFELAGEQDAGRRKDLVDYAAKLRGMYDDRHAFWEKDLIASDMRKLLLEESYAPAMEFYRIQDNEFLPAVKAGDEQKVKALLYGPLKKAYQDHLAIIRKLVEKAEAKIQRIESEAADTLRLDTWLLYAAIFVIMCASVALTYFVLAAITRIIGKNLAFAECVAHGDLQCDLEVRQKDELGQLAEALRKMVGNLRGKIEESEEIGRRATAEAARAKQAETEAEKAQSAAVTKTESMVEAAGRLQRVAEITMSASEELSAQIEQSSKGAEQQALRVTETATAMEEMNATVLEVAKNASDAAEISDDAKGKAQEGAAIVGKVVRGIGDVQAQALELKDDMSKLGAQAEGIGQIMAVISDIADQTNLLALNAAIEAARAGEAGRGFAVVADEVRKLAEKTMTATKEVGDAIGGIQDGTRKNMDNVDRSVKTIGEATSLASQSGEALNAIVHLVERTSDQVRAIAAASEQQSAASEEINRSIEEVNVISNETAEAMTQAAQAVTELARQSQELKTLIDEMRSGGDATPRSLGAGKRLALA